MSDLTAADERPHPIGDDRAWSESYYFNFVDPKSGIGAFTRMGFRANEGWADGLHGVYLGGERVLFCYGRRNITKDDQQLTVGGLTLELEEPFKRWTLRYDGPAQDVADSPVLLMPRKDRPEGWYRDAHLDMTLVFDAIAEPHAAWRGPQGHFEQTCAVSGTITVGDERFGVTGYGVRDKSWGPRTWAGGSSGGSGSATAAEPKPVTGPRPFTLWFSGNFGADAAFGCSCGTLPDGTVRGAGWYQRDGENMNLTIDGIDSTYRPDSVLHNGGKLNATAEDGTKLAMDFTVPTVCVTKIAMPGGATLVNEGLAKFQLSDGTVGHGIAEYWHAVTR